MSGAGPNAEGPGYLLPDVANRSPVHLAVIAKAEAKGREDFFLAVDGAFQLLHGRHIARLRCLMAEMDSLTARAEAGSGELVTCWRNVRLVLNLIDIESETTP